MGGGETVIMYLLQVKRFAEKNGGKILYMEELYNLDPSIFQAPTVRIPPIFISRLLACYIPTKIEFLLS